MFDGFSGALVAAVLRPGKYPTGAKNAMIISLENSSADDSVAASFRHEEDEGNLSEEDRLSLDKFFGGIPEQFWQSLGKRDKGRYRTRADNGP